MEARTAYLNKIDQQLRMLEVYANTNDRSIHANFLTIASGLLNIVYGYHLVAANTPSGIDLIDQDTAVAVQITMSLTQRKLRSIIQSFTSGTQGQRPCDLYRTLLVFVVCSKQPSYTKNTLEDISAHIITLSDLCNLISHLPVNKLLALAEFLDVQLGESDDMSSDVSSDKSSSRPPLSEETIAHIKSRRTELQTVLHGAYCLPKNGLPRDLFFQCLSTNQQQDLSLLVQENLLYHRNGSTCIDDESRRFCLTQLLPTSKAYYEIPDRLLLYDRTRFWKRLPLKERRKIFLLLAEFFGRAAAFSDPNGSIALRCAGFYAQANRPDKELHWNRRAMHTCQDLQVADIWSLGYACLRTAECYQKLNDSTNALKFCKKILSLSDLVTGLSDPDLCIVHNQIGTAYIGLQKYHDAVTHLETALDCSKNVLDPDHPLRRTINDNLNICYQAMGNVITARAYKLESIRSDSPDSMSDKAKQKLHQLEQLLKNTSLFRSRSEDTLNFQIGELYYTENDYSKALEYHLQALNLREQHHDTPKKHLADSYHHVGVVFHDLGDSNEALNYLRIALDIRETTPNIPPEDLFHSYIALADVYSNGDLPRHTMDLLQKALALQKEHANSIQPTDQAKLYTALGCTCRNMGLHEDALNYYNIALTIRLQSHLQNTPELASSYMDVAIACLQLEYYLKGLDSAYHARNICNTIYPDGHPQQIVAGQLLEQLTELADKS